MRVILTAALMLCVVAAAWAKGVVKAPSSSPVYYFTENLGQVKDQHGQPRTDIQFRAAMNGLSIFIGNGQIHYQFNEFEDRISVSGRARGKSEDPAASLPVETYRLDVKLIGANNHAVVVTEQEASYQEYYYLPDPISPRSFGKITYKDVYPNIDWIFYSKAGVMKYEFVVHPGGNPDLIRLSYEGANSLSTDNGGRLTATTPLGSISEQAPYSFELSNNRKVDSKFIVENGVVSFKVSSYSGTLVIDPILEWATYYSGASQESFVGLSGDAAGNIYGCGEARSSSNIATSGSFQNTINGITNGLVVKFNSAGVRQWGTYFGAGANRFIDIRSDANGDLYISGIDDTTGGSLATPGAYQTVPYLPGSASVTLTNLLVKFNSSGQRIWCTYFHGGHFPYLDFDGYRNLYLFGMKACDGPTLPTPGAYQTTCASGPGGRDLYLARFDTSGSLVWATYFGGESNENNFGVACDRLGGIYITGETNSYTGIGTSGAFQPSHPGGDPLFLAKFDSSGNRLWGTYYGDGGDTWGGGIAADSNGDAYMYAGVEDGTGIATAGTFQPAMTYSGDFIAKFNSSGVRQWATFTFDSCVTNDIAVANGKVYVTGAATDPGLATSGAYQATNAGFSDAFLMRLNSVGQRDWSTYYGGSLYDLAYDVYCDQSNHIIIAGMTQSTSGIATAGAHQTVYGGGSSDAFLAKFIDSIVIPSADSVWPGDANDDLTADALDALAVAVAYSETGPARVSPTTSWVAQHCFDWSGTFTSGANKKHADCNGDGTVDAGDLGAITANYGLTHPKPTPHHKTTADPDLYFDITGINFLPGANVSVPIKLGSAANPMNGFYGLATNVMVGGITLSAPATITYTGSWLGNTSNTLELQKQISNSDIGWAYSRRDHQNQNGSGTIAALNFTIPSTATPGSMIDLQFGSVDMINKDMTVLTAYNVLDTSVMIGTLSVGSMENQNSNVRIVPNPSQTSAAIEYSSARASHVDIVVIDAAGKHVFVMSRDLNRGMNKIALPISNFSAGVYTISLREGNRTQTLKWVKQ